MKDQIEINVEGRRFRNTEDFKPLDPTLPGVVVNLLFMNYRIIGADVIADTDDNANTGTFFVLQREQGKVIMVLIEQDTDWHDELETVFHIMSAEAEEIV